MSSTDIKEYVFLRDVAQNAPRFMWLLGAGTSRSAGLPTATDITWDLKRKLYCRLQDQDVKAHDVNNKAVKAKIQRYFDSQSFPPLNDPAEYSFYFEKSFGSDYAAQQQYLSAALSHEKVSVTIGHRALAAMMRIGAARLTFTTNFDDVIESAYANVNGTSLSTFHLEGSYAALDALNAEQFPIYAKLHGDFRYQRIKNLTDDLKANDKKIATCFLAAAARFGLILAGYSGRDGNVMALLADAINQPNAFPQGLFWTIPAAAHVAPHVTAFIELARSKGINAGVVEIGSFDVMMSKIWRQLEHRPEDLDLKVRSAMASTVSIALPAAGTRFPILRLNAFPFVKLPVTCGTFEYDGAIPYTEMREKFYKNGADCIVAYTDKALFWGASVDLAKGLEANKISSVKALDLGDLAQLVKSSTRTKAFVEETVIRALISGKRIQTRKQHRTYYAVVDREHSGADMYKPLRAAVGSNGNLGAIHGSVPGIEATWSEACSIRIEERNGSLLLMLRPGIWISPMTERERATDFVRQKNLRRWNIQAYDILNAWIGLLIAEVGQSTSQELSAFGSTDYPASFALSTRSAFSKRSAGDE